MNDFRNDAWLAGFTDGEGCFHLAFKRALRGGRYEVSGLQPRFEIKLRADDVAVLEKLRSSFGGTVRFSAGHRPDNGNRKPRYAWSVGAKKELVGLVDYFDRFPLRAKKARDYSIWRRAVVAYVARGPHAPELPALREALIIGRRYESDEEIFVSDIVGPQLALSEEIGWLDEGELDP